MDFDPTKLEGSKVALRKITNDDLVELYQLIYGEHNPEWKKWDAPYFPLEYKRFDVFHEEIIKQIDSEKPCPRMIIQSNNQIIGTVSYYWEHKASHWLEIGIVIFRPEFWNGGYGTEALQLWIEYLFKELPLVRVGLTTWSGNTRMIKVAEKLGMQLEGRLRKCRLYDGKYYDSIRMGILREEWYAMESEMDSDC